MRFLKTVLQPEWQNPTASAVPRSLGIASAETVPLQFPTKRTVADAKLPDGVAAIGIGDLLATRRTAMLKNQRATPDVAFPERHIGRNCENFSPDSEAFVVIGVRQ